MSLNPNIILGVKSPKIEQPDPVEQYTQRLKLKDLLTQQQANERSMADDAAQRDAFARSGGDQAKYLQALASGGNYKAYAAAQKQSLDTEKQRADISHLGSQTAQANATAGKTAQEVRFAAADRHARDLANVQTPQDVVAYVDQGISSGVFPREAREQMLKKAAQAPSIEAWKQQQQQLAIPVVEKYKVEAENSRNAANNQTRITTTGMTNAVTMRGQNMTDARSRDSNGKAPAGYVWGPAGPDGTPTMIAAKGGPADLKMAGALNQDTQALNGSMSSFDRLAAAANEVMNHPGLKGITGKQGVFPNVPGGEASNAEALLGTLKSQVGFGVLQDMRNNSKTGGALGSVSDAEGKRLEANLAALDKSQSLEQFQRNLKKIIDYSQGAKDRLRDAYNLKHGSGSVNPVRSGGASGSFGQPPEKTKTGASVSNW